MISLDVLGDIEQSDTLKTKRKIYGDDTTDDDFPTPEEELCITDKALFWRTGHGLKTKSSFSFELPVTQALWCDFVTKKSRRERFLCILLNRERVSMFAVSGKVYEVALPCKIEKMWSLPPCGLLMQRMESEDEGPVVFTLTHPLEELKPLSVLVNDTMIKTMSMSPSSPSIPIFLNDGNDHHRALHSKRSSVRLFSGDIGRVVTICPILNVVVTHRIDRKEHSFWLMKPCPQMSIKESRNMQSKTTLTQDMMNTSIMTTPRSPISPATAPAMVTPPRTTIAEAWGRSELFDEDEHQQYGHAIHPNWMLTSLTRDDTMSSLEEGLPARTIFPVLDFQVSNRNLDQMLMVMLCGTHLRMLRVQQEKRVVSLVSSLGDDVLSAVPISTSAQQNKGIFPQDSDREDEDSSFLRKEETNFARQEKTRKVPTRTLVLRKAGSLWMYHGHRLIGRCGLQNNDSKDRKSIVTDISDAVSNRVTLHLHNGTCVRVAVPCENYSRLTSLCFDVLCSVLSDEDATRLESHMTVVLSSPLFCSSSSSSSSSNETRRSRHLRTRHVKDDVTTTNIHHVTSKRRDWYLLRAVILHSFGIRCSSSSDDDEDEEERPLKSLRGNGGDDENNVVDTTSTKPANAWDSLCNSEYHRHIQNERSHVVSSLCSVSRSKSSSKDKENRTTDDDDEEDISIISPIRLTVPRAKAFFAIHLLYEDCKLSKTRWSMLKPLGHLLATLAHVSWSNQSSSVVRAYIDHYRRDGGFFSIPHSRLKSSTMFSASLVKHEIKNLKSFSKNPPNIISHLMNLIRRGEKSESLCSFDIPISSLSNSSMSSQRLRRTQEICSYYEDLSDVNSVVTRMVRDGMTRELLGSDVPFGISLPLLQVLRRAKDDPPLNWPRSAYVLIQREDIASILGRRRRRSHCDVEKDNVLSLDLLVESVQDEDDTLLTNTDSEQTQEIEQQQRDSLSTDGLKEIRIQSRLRFSEDQRVKEVSRLLRSSKSMRLVLDRHADTSDADLAAEQQNALKHLCARAMALPVARGMFTMSVTRPLLTETLPIPELVLAARLPPNDAIVKLDMSAYTEDTTYWPQFHNGVAAALRLGRSRESLTRTWIVYNRPKQPNYEHAGFLLALGLQGHLTCLRTTDFYMYLSQRHHATTAGLLLGLAANHRGKADASVFKMLCLHLPALLPASFSEISTSSVVQITALLGVGLLYQATAHRLTVEFLLEEIGRGASERDEGDRAARGGAGSSGSEGYSLAAGLGLGMIALGCGRYSNGNNENDTRRHHGLLGLSDLRLEERLQRYMTGGKDKHDWVNTSITSVGATLALGLIFLKSGNRSVAARLAAPDTLFLLDYVRPDQLLIRTLARGLVMWDHVRGTEEWIRTQVPLCLRSAVKRLLETGVHGMFTSGTSEHDMLESILGAKEGGEEIEEKSDEDAMVVEDQETKKKVEEVDVQNEENIDAQSVRQAYANIIAGTCAAIGYRYAGTGDRDAYNILMHHLRRFAIMRGAAVVTEPPPEDETRLNEIRKKRAQEKRLLRRIQPDRATLEMCLGTIAVAIGMVMAGRGDLSALRLLRELRNKTGSRVTYGTHMVLNSAIGLLFLAGGTATLSRSDASIAALLCAFFPRYPTTCTDNYTHLQSFRHLYVLAADYRMLDLVDVNTGTSLLVPLRVDLRDNKGTLCLRSPCLLPEISSIEAIRINSERYWPLNLLRPAGTRVDTSKNEKNRSKGWTLELKRKVAHLSHEQDPLGLRSLLTRLLPEDMQRRRRAIEEFIDVFDLAPEVRIFAQEFAGLSSGDVYNGKNDDVKFCSTILYECLANDKLEMMQSYFEIRETQRSILEFNTSSPEQFCSFLQKCWNLKLAFTVFESSVDIRRLELDVSKRLSSFMKNNKNCLAVIRNYIAKEEVHNPDVLSLRILSLVLVFFEIPTVCALSDIVRAVKQGDPESFFAKNKTKNEYVRPDAILKVMGILSGEIFF